MSANLTRHSLGWTFTSVVILLLLFWGRSAVHPVELTASYVEKMPLGIVLENFAGANQLLATGLILLIVLLNTVLITRIVTRNMIYTDKIFLPGIIYITVSCGVFFGTGNITSIVVSWLMVCSCDLMLSSFRRQKMYGSTFVASILLGTAVILYAPSIVYVIMIPCALGIFRKDWHEAVISVAGYILPFLLCSYVYWGMGESFSYLGLTFYNALLSHRYQGAFPADFLRPDLMAFWGITAITTLSAIIFFLKKAGIMRTRPYKSFTYFIWMLVVSVLLFIVPSRSINDFPLIAVPLAVILPTFFEFQNRWISNIAYIAFIGSIVMFNLLPFFTVR